MNSGVKNFWAIPKPARIPPQTPPAGGTEAEAGRIHIPSQMFRPAESAFRSKKVRAKDIISPPIETSRFERVAPRGREAAARSKIPRRFAANWLAGQKSKTADLSVSYPEF